LDTGRIQLADGGVQGLVRPAMGEIVRAAGACGVRLEEDVVEKMIECDPLELYLKPSMLADVEKVCSSFLEGRLCGNNDDTDAACV
jgi:ketopantoate reductase